MTSGFAAAESTFSTVSRGAEEGNRRGTRDARERDQGRRFLGRQRPPRALAGPGGRCGFRPGGPRSLFTPSRWLSAPGIRLVPLHTFFFLGHVPLFYRKMSGRRVLQEKNLTFQQSQAVFEKKSSKSEILGSIRFPKEI